MSDKSSAVMPPTTKVVGYFNPHKHPICVEISEINLKVELSQNVFIKDSVGRLINDPIFERYCHAKGLARSFAEQPVPIIMVPRFARRETQPVAVRQATGFVRQGGRTVPTFATVHQSPQREVALNKTPYAGMTMDQARKLGLVGKPRLIPEDYGADESSTGAPKNTDQLPDIRYSMESRPKNPAVAAGIPALRPELSEAGQDLPPEEAAKRTSLAQRLTKAAGTPTGDEFDPATVKAPVPVVPVAPATIPAQPPSASAPKTTTARRQRRVAAPVRETPQATVPQPESQLPAPETAQTAETEESQEEPQGGGVVAPLNEGNDEMPPPDLETQETEPQAGEQPAAEGQNFVCAADGKTFKFRSLLLRHVLRKFPHMKEDLMKPYPPDSQ